MRDQWYGDTRDLVKWGVLVELASHFRTKHILQVLSYRATLLNQALEIDGRSVILRAVVARQFRKVTNIASLPGEARVELIDCPFGDREAYLQHVLERMRARKVKSSLSSLDTDQVFSQGLLALNTYWSRRLRPSGRNYNSAMCSFSANASATEAARSGSIPSRNSWRRLLAFPPEG